MYARMKLARAKVLAAGLVGLAAVGASVAPAATAVTQDRVMRAVCYTLDTEGSTDAVFEGIMRGFVDLGIDTRTAASITVDAVRDLCPEHHPALRRYADV